jgi:hypothetical protein
MLVPTLASARTMTNSSGLSLLILFSSMSAVWNSTIRNSLELVHGQNQGGSSTTYHDLELQPHLLQDVLPRHRRRSQDQLRRDERCRSVVGGAYLEGLRRAARW